MILMEFAAGAGILLEKWLSGHHCAEDQLNPQKYPKLLFSKMMNGARRRELDGPPWAQTMPRRGPQPGRAWGWSGRPGPPLTPPFRVYHPHGNLRSGGRQREEFRRRYEAENTRERKALRQAEICWGKLPPGGGDRRHRHRHHAGLHQDHHHHHLHHYFISDPEPYDVS